MKLFTATHQYQNYRKCSTQSLDHDHLVAEMNQRQQSDSNFELLSITESDIDVLYCDHTMDNQFTTFIIGCAVKVGERHLDARCTGTRAFYTLPECLEEAKAQFDQECEQQRNASDSYYSQSFV